MLSAAAFQASSHVHFQGLTSLFVVGYVKPEEVFVCV